ncbi:MAG: type I-D CRISPR-associated protein Cas5/Csc1 [Myxococcota bacterium]
MTRVFRLEWTLHEPMLFVSREFGSLYQTEPLIGHYAQSYALGLAQSTYRLDRSIGVGPRYADDLGPLAEQGVYLTPARPTGRVRLRFERFNALGEGLRSRMDQGAVVDDLDVLLSGRSGRPVNRPQQGVWQLVERGSRFESFLICDCSATPPAVVPWARLGKTLAKAAVSVAESPEVTHDHGTFASAAFLAATDLPDDLEPLTYELVSIPPAPILRDAKLQGAFLGTSFGALPASLSFRFDP